MRMIKGERERDHNVRICLGNRRETSVPWIQNSESGKEKCSWSFWKARICLDARV